MNSVTSDNDFNDEEDYDSFHIGCTEDKLKFKGFQQDDQLKSSKDELNKTEKFPRYMIDYIFFKKSI